MWLHGGTLPDRAATAASLPTAFPVSAEACSRPLPPGIGEITGLRCVARTNRTARSVQAVRFVGFLPQPQAAPFTEKPVGEASLPAQVPWNPMDVEPLAGIWAL